MGWQIGFDEKWQRDVGYGVPAICDHPDCNELIDRGLSYVCGNDMFGGENGCGLYFCEKHAPGPDQICERCANHLEPFKPKPDTAEWINHKMTDPSWAKWREENEILQLPKQD